MCYESVVDVRCPLMFSGTITVNFKGPSSLIKQTYQVALYMPLNVRPVGHLISSHVLFHMGVAWINASRENKIKGTVGRML